MTTPPSQPIVRLAKCVNRLITRSFQSITHVSSRSPRSTMSLVIMITFTLYILGAQARLGGASGNNHFAYLAQAFLNGQTSLTTAPPHGNDWASYEVLTLTHPLSGAQIDDRDRGEGRGEDHGEGSRDDPPSQLTLRGIFINGAPRGDQVKVFRTLRGARHRLSRDQIKTRTRRYFVSFPPLPALLMLPWVALFGLAASDVWLTLIFATLNGPLALSLFRIISGSKSARDSNLMRSDQELLWVVISLTLGTAHLWCAVRGEVWFTALIIGVTCQLLFLRWAWGMRRPLLAGLALAAAFSTRASLITLSLFFYLQVVWPLEERTPQERIKRALQFSIPPLIIGVSLLYYNSIRFERWYEFGHTYLAGGQLKRIQEYGLFHSVFLYKNIVAAFLLLPLISFQAPYLIYSWHGQAIQWTSPHLLWALSLRQERSSLTRPRALLGVVAMITMILLLLYQNTGWVQYSWRFSLDVIPILSCLIVLNGRPLNTRLFKSAVLWGVFINLIGALAFGRLTPLVKGLNLPALWPH